MQRTKQESNREQTKRTKCEYLLVIVVVEDGDGHDHVVVQTDKSRLVEPGFSSCLPSFLYPGLNQRTEIQRKERAIKVPSTTDHAEQN